MLVYACSKSNRKGKEFRVIYIYENCEISTIESRVGAYCESSTCFQDLWEIELGQIL